MNLNDYLYNIIYCNGPTTKYIIDINIYIYIYIYIYIFISIAILISK